MGEAEHAHAIGIEGVDAGDIALQGEGVLETENDRGFALILRGADLIGGAGKGEPLWISGDAGLDGVELGRDLCSAFRAAFCGARLRPGGEGHDDRIDAARYELVGRDLGLAIRPEIKRGGVRQRNIGMRVEDEGPCVHVRCARRWGRGAGGDADQERGACEERSESERMDHVGASPGCIWPVSQQDWALAS